MSNEDILFLNYCMSLLTIINLSNIKYIEDVKINTTEMTFRGKYYDSWLFDRGPIPLDDTYHHESIENGLDCNFRVFR